MPATHFTYRPDASAPTIERWEWLTDVSRAADGTESRRALRKRPRCTVSYRVTADGLLAHLLRQGYAGAWVVPLPQHAKPVAAWTPGPTLYEAHVSAYPAYIDIVPAGTPPAAGVQYIAPAALARLMSARAEGFATVGSPWSGPGGGEDSFELTWLLEEPPLTLPAAPQYLSITANWSNSIPTQDMSREVAVLDTGRVRVEDELHAVTYADTTASWTLQGAEIYSTLALLHATAGRLNTLEARVGGDSYAAGHLESDTVELAYIAPGLADMSLTIREAVVVWS